MGRLFGALGLQLRQELRCFSVALEGSLVLLELIFELLVAVPKPVDLCLLGAALGSPELRDATVQSTYLLGPAPLDNVPRVEALSAQEGPLFVRVRAALVLIVVDQRLGAVRIDVDPGVGAPRS